MLPVPESRWPRILRTLAFWVTMVVGSIALVQYASNRRHDAVAISYNQFVQELDRGNIAAVEITEGGRVRGEFKSPIAGRSPTTHHFAMILPFASSEAWVATLVVRWYGFDLRGLPDDDEARRASLRSSLGGLRRGAEHAFRLYGGPPRTVDGAFPPFQVLGTPMR